MTCSKIYMAVLLYFVTAGLFLKAAADPCSSSVYRTIPNMGFRFINYRLDASDVLYHDFQLQAGWYYVGSETMPEYPPDDIFTCGTKFPVWLNGTHPKGNSQVTMTACQLGIIEDCDVKYSIKIQRCTGYYVYYLYKTSSTNVGYCFGEGLKGKSPKFVPSKPNILVGTTTKQAKRGNVTSAYFTCDFKESTTESLLYIVTWYMNSVAMYMTDYQKAASNPGLRLTEEIFKQKGFTMGSTISCSIRTFYKKNSSPSRQSPLADNFFAGIKVLTPNLTFRSHESDTSKRSIRLQPTVPIGCWGSTCDIAVVAYVPDNHGKCTGLAFEESTCGVKLHSQSYSDIREITVKSTDDQNYYHSGSFEVFLKIQNTNENIIWGKYNLPPIKITIIEDNKAQVYQGKRCHSINDPHMITFDGRRYDNHQEGDYILYRNTKYNTEVQARYYNCGSRFGKPIKCNCGVAVKAGQDLFNVNVCAGKLFIGYRFCADKTLEVKSDGEWKYKIFFAYGTYVETTIYGSNPMSMNTYVIPSSKDVGVVYGLCGDIDGDYRNDFHYRPGEGSGKPNLNSINPSPKTTWKGADWEFNHQPTSFLQVWKVRSEAENLFSSNVDKNQFTRWSFEACVCTNKTVNETKSGFKTVNSIPCTPNGVATCMKGKTIGTHTCSVFKSRRRRSVDRNPIIPEVYIDTRRFKKRSVPSTNMTEAEARQYCQDNIGSSKVFSLCSTVPSVNTNSSLDTCVGDIMLTGTTDWTESTRESMQDSCLSELVRNTTLQESKNNKTSIAKQIEDIACPNNCSSAGICVKGKCNCDVGYGGSDCSTDMSKGPSISGLLDHGMCDEKDLPCDHAYVFGSIFADTDNLTCRLEEFHIPDGGKKQLLQTHYVSGEFETFIETICPLTTTRRKRSVSDTGKTFVTGYTISVSNDGNTFEKGKDLFIYDSTCQKMRNDSNTLSFTLKTGFCFIDNVCISDNILSTKDTCLKCKADTSPRSWTTVDTQECGKLHPNSVSKTPSKTGSSTKYLWIIGVVAGVIVGVVVGVLVVIKLTKKSGIQNIVGALYLTHVADGKIISRFEKIPDGGKKQLLQTHYVSGEFETFIETICPLTTTRRKRSVSDTGKTFVTGYTISVSNDGNTFEKGKDLFIYDSTCQKMRNDSNTLSFTLKTGFCFIDNVCISDNILSTKDTCLKCKADTSPRSWTTVDTQECGKLHPNSVSKTPSKTGSSTKYLWIIGVVAGVIVGVVVGVLVVIKLTKKRGKKVSDSSLFERDDHNVQRQNSAK